MSDLAKTTGPGSIAALPNKTSFLPLKQCETLEQAFKTQEFQERIAASVPQHIQPNRMLRTFVQAVTRTPLLAQASVRSFVGACLSLSQIGLEPNTPLGHAFLIPFKTTKWNPRTRQREEGTVEINVIPGYPGLLDLSFRSRLVRSVHADVVWPGDEFSFEYGSNAHVRHKPTGMSRKPNGQPVYAYMHAVLQDGQAFEVMPYSDILAIRNKSQAYRAAAEARDHAQEKGWKIPASYTEAPWVAHEIAMAKKTAFRGGSKWLPRSVEIASIIALDEAQERRRRMDFSTVLDAPTINGTPDYLTAAVDAAQSQEDEQEPATPDAAFQDRRTPADNPPPDDEDAWRGEVARDSKPVADQSADNRRKPPTTPPAFEAVMIDASGEPMEGPPLHSAKAFARAYMMLWREYDQAEDAAAIDALAEHNADSLEVARQSPDAAAIFAEMDAQDERQTNSPTIFVPVSPPVERGRIAWPTYIRLLKIDLGQQPNHLLAPWAEANRETLATTPMAQRILGIRAVAERMGSAGITPQAWLGELMRPPAKTPKADPGDEPQPDEQIEAPAEQPVREPTSDEKWVTKTLSEIEAMDRPAFDAFIKSPAVRSFMARLQRENLALFDKADLAFLGRHRKLPTAAGTGK